jgi:GT2 family glycosyltransferase
MYTNLAIAVFGYSRPRHLIQLLDSIELNSEVDLIKLYIFIDGEKVDKNTREVSNCFQIAQEFASRHSNTEIYKHQKNLGLSNSIRFGIDYIFERHNEVIVLEDD